MLIEKGAALIQSPTTGALLAPPVPIDSDSNRAPARLKQAELTAPAVTPAPTFQPQTALEHLERWITRVAKLKATRFDEPDDLASVMRLAILTAKPGQQLSYYRGAARKSAQMYLRTEYRHRSGKRRLALLGHHSFDDYSEDSQP